MYLVCGLGNPGKNFHHTRHNVGFLVLERLLRDKKFPKFKIKKEFQGKISKGKIGEKEIILLQPQTFMNNSGVAVKLVLQNYGIAPKNLWIIHDDVSIPFGKIKVSFGKSPGGHKGVASIIEKLQTKEFFRIRIGIGPLPKDKLLKDFVLEKFKKEERKKLKEVIKKAILALEISITEKPEKAMEIFNK